MKKIFIILVLALIPVMDMAAQGTGYGRGSGRGPRDGPGPPPAVPIDGGLTILLAAGGLYGAKKLRDHMKGED